MDEPEIAADGLKVNVKTLCWVCSAIRNWNSSPVL